MFSSEINKVHFIGIGGYGMSALADVLLKKGYRVSGSDIKDSKIIQRLLEMGADIHIGHHPDNLKDCDLVVYSTAIPPHNQELKEAARKVTLWHRSRLLALLLNQSQGVAVGGTHGKTTTTTMLALLLEKGGKDPTVLVGGEVGCFNGNARLGSGNCLVAEACESDNSFLLYQPLLSIVTNVEAEHLEYYQGDFNRLKEAYYSFLNNMKEEGEAILNYEDDYLKELSFRLPFKVSTFAVEGAAGMHEATFSARELEFFPRGSRFKLYCGEQKLGEVNLAIPGRHNISNAMAALVAAYRLGVDPVECSDVLLDFKGADRRFEIVSEAGGITLVDDYAHHPTEIKATLQAARNCGKRVIAVFQPHRYSRTSYFMKEFADSFNDADVVLLHPVYSAGEEPIEGINSLELAELIRNREKGKPVHYIEEFSRIAETAYHYASPGDVIIFMGAGDIWKAARIIKEYGELTEKEDSFNRRGL